jgi:oligoendopeptidase F
MNVWKWLYQNPQATPSQLKEKVITTAKEIWNAYYAPVFGIKDQPILAIYSHMIDNPLYLSNYPIGHLIEFQIERYIKDKNFANEVLRMFSNGKLTPKYWMINAVGKELSSKPLIEAASEALKYVK